MERRVGRTGSKRERGAREAYAKFLPLLAEAGAEGIFRAGCSAAERWPEVANAAILIPEVSGGGAFSCFACARGTGVAGGERAFPFWLFDAEGEHRRENVTDWAVDQFRARYGNPALSKWSLFDYVYGVLHHPGYRAAFAGELKRGWPRLPMAEDFRAFQQGGQRLLELHVNSGRGSAAGEAAAKVIEGLPAACW